MLVNSTHHLNCKFYENQRNTEVESQWLWSEDQLRVSGMYLYYLTRDRKHPNHSPFVLISKSSSSISVYLTEKSKRLKNIISKMLSWLAVSCGTSCGTLLVWAIMTNIPVNLPLKSLHIIYQKLHTTFYMQHFSTSYNITYYVPSIVYYHILNIVYYAPIYYKSKE